MKQFSSFGGFAAHLSEIIATDMIANTVIMDGVGQLVERRAKQKIGDYQDQAGPFIGWEELAESTIEDRVRQGYSEDEPGLRSGEMRESIHHKGDAEKTEIGSDDDKLVWFELGTDKQPPRSVLGGAAFEATGEILERIGEGFVAHLTGEGVVAGAMRIA